MMAGDGGLIGGGAAPGSDDDDNAWRRRTDWRREQGDEQMPVGQQITEAAERVVGHVSADRLWQRHMDLARFGAREDGGVDRQALSAEEIAARQHLIAIVRARGLGVATDPAGNLFIRLAGREPHLPPVLSGSHIDSQPTGGRFDGIFGVLAALEVLEALRDSGHQPRRSIEAVAWMNEEGSRFAPGMMGSEAFAGVRPLDEILAVADADGCSVAEALAQVNAAFPDVPVRELGMPVEAYVEAHIEQGPVLEAQGRAIGAVTGIQGKQTFRVTVTGEEAHAGTKPMAERRDALIAASAMVQRLHGIARAADDALMFTVGRFIVSPNAPSVVPARVVFSIDLRHFDSAVVRRFGDAVAGLCAELAQGCTVQVERLVDAPSLIFPDSLRRRTRDIAAVLGHAAMDLPSAAGHDARHLNAVAPSAMIFIPCHQGISHHPTERAAPADIHAGARVLAALLVELAG
ncbi:Zn-dependent hydrolase [Tistrella bauzanensis]|uniref:Zn-dependent hydrolase n=2 Tax=Tistrella bauzanensis TaxID=657419 RepID=A0ABQ1II49_9PROT|nr:M20 family metallo-hydrolase [Tistrella bauzanensis]GGB42726.1 Zn-dependent hydrolase [Tistrella bauzanensis]